MYRAPTLAPPAAAAPAPPSEAAAIAAAAAGELDQQPNTAAGGQGVDAKVPADMSNQAIAGDSSVEAFGAGVKGGLAGGLRLGDRVTSIPRDGSMLDVSGVVLFPFSFVSLVTLVVYLFVETYIYVYSGILPRFAVGCLLCRCCFVAVFVVVEFDVEVVVAVYR